MLIVHVLYLSTLQVIFSSMSCLPYPSQPLHKIDEVKYYLLQTQHMNIQTGMHRTHTHSSQSRHVQHQYNTICMHVNSNMTINQLVCTPAINHVVYIWICVACVSIELNRLSILVSITQIKCPINRHIIIEISQE